MDSQAVKEEVANTTKLELKLFVDHTSNRILFAEASKYVADCLLGFLGLSLGYATRLVGKQLPSNSVASLCSSFESLSDDYLTAPAKHRAALLNPNTSSYSVVFLQNIPNSSIDKKVKIYYKCTQYNYHHYLSEVVGVPCPDCWCSMSTEMKVLQREEEAGNGYVKEVVSYMVMDDLALVPMSSSSVMELLNKFQVKDVSSLDEAVVEVGMEEVLEILKASLQSKTVLTDVFLPKFKGRVSIECVE
ncbi:uncharacterized protein [Typha angustifolia]|uniref:uncharacterized protein n=1 Tax=Typha angustifolia TaxID=59011 RepID=UPI003C2ACECF